MRAGLALIRGDPDAQRRLVSLLRCFDVRWSLVRL